MRPDSEAIVHDLAPRTIKVWVCGDVHVGAQGAQLEAWQKFLDMVEEDDDSYAIFVGDLMDNATRGSKGDIWTGMTPADAMDYITRCLRPLAAKGKVLAMLTGNHELRTARETSIDPLYDICVRLGIEDVYRRDFAAIRVKMKQTKGCLRAYNLICFHGASDLKTRQMMNNLEGFDALITGHTHQPIVRVPAHLCMTQSGKVTMKELVQVTACSWCDYIGYGARGMYQPQVQSRPQALVLEWDSSQSHDKHIGVSW